MKSFKINEKIEIVCEWKKTRNGFKHEATLLFNGNEQETAKVCYLNRTWESYEYQTVLKRIVEKSQVLSEEEKALCLNFINKDQTDYSSFNMTANIAKLGEIFCTTQKEKNDWKERMLRAGLENQGLSIPEDWDTLDEETKEKRLNAVIELSSTIGKKD